MDRSQRRVCVTGRHGLLVLVGDGALLFLPGLALLLAFFLLSLLLLALALALARILTVEVTAKGRRLVLHLEVASRRPRLLDLVRARGAAQLLAQLAVPRERRHAACALASSVHQELELSLGRLLSGLERRRKHHEGLVVLLVIRVILHGRCRRLRGRVLRFGLRFGVLGVLGPVHSDAQRRTEERVAAGRELGEGAIGQRLVPGVESLGAVVAFDQLDG